MDVVVEGVVNPVKFGLHEDRPPWLIIELTTEGGVTLCGAAMVICVLVAFDCSTVKELLAELFPVF